MTAADWQARILALVDEAQTAGYDIRCFGCCCPNSGIEITNNEDLTDVVEFSF